MELKQYWTIFRRRIWIAILLTIAAGATSFVVSPKVQTTYIGTTRVLVSVTPEQPVASVYQYDRYYTWVASEYLVDDLSELVKSQSFVNDLRQALAGSNVDPAAVQPAIETKKSHRLLAISFAAPSADWAAKITGTAAELIGKQAATYLAQLSYQKPQFSVVDPPVVSSQATSMRSNVDIALRTGLGLIAGLALILLLDYMDSSVRDAVDLQGVLGTRVLGEIPPAKNSWWRPFGRTPNP